MNKFIGGLCIILLAMCSGNKQQADSSVDSTIGSRQTSTAVEPLLVITAGVWDELYHKHRDKYGYDQPDDVSRPVLIVGDNARYKTIILPIIGDPALITIDQSGHPIDTLYLLSDAENNDPETHTIERAIVETDRSVHLLDTVLTFRLNSAGESIESSRTLIVESEHYRILASGYFEKVN